MMYIVIIKTNYTQCLICNLIKTINYEMKTYYEKRKKQNNDAINK